MDVKIVVIINDVHAADNPIYGYIFCIIFVYSYKFKLNELMDQYRKKKEEMVLNLFDVVLG